MTINKRIKIIIALAVLLVFLVLLCVSGTGRDLLNVSYPQDSHIFLMVNGWHNAFFDPIMLAASSKLFWIPFYLILVYVLYRSFGKKVWLTLLIIGLLIASADQVSSGIIKNHVQRLRPSHEVKLMPLIHLSKAGAGGMYGFASSHAANAFALCIFLIMILDKKYKTIKIIVGIWAILVSYSRIYNGVHYPSDVLVGAAIGILLGAIFALLHTGLQNKWKNSL